MDMKAQRFGIEVEMTGVTRENAARIAAEYFGTASRYLDEGYDSAGFDTEFLDDAVEKPIRLAREQQAPEDAQCNLWKQKWW